MFAQCRQVLLGAFMGHAITTDRLFGFVVQLPQGVKTLFGFDGVETRVFRLIFVFVFLFLVFGRFGLGEGGGNVVHRIQITD